MKRIDWRKGADAIGKRLHADANGHPLSHVPRGSAVGTNLDDWPHITKTQANKLWKELGLEGEPVHLGSNMYGFVIELTPLLAHHWLTKRNVQENRVPTEAQLAALARDNLRGNMVLMDNAISFNAEGGLENGQHRCWSVVVAGHPVKVLVCINMPVSARNVMDQTVRRMAQCMIKSLGDSPLTSRQLAVIRGAMFGFEPAQHVTIDEMLAFVSEHMKAFEWLFWYFDKNIPRVTTGPVQYAVFRAYKSLGRTHHDRLGQFADYMVSHSFDRCGIGRFSAARDGAVASYRDWLLAATPARQKASPRTIYVMTTLAIQAFIDHRGVDGGQLSREAAKVTVDPFPKPAPICAREEPFSVTDLLLSRMKALDIDPSVLNSAEQEAANTI